MISNENTIASRIREIMDDTPIGFGIHDAERARLCAERAIEVGDEELFLFVIAEGFKKIFSAEHTRMRARARRQTNHAVKHKNKGMQQLMIAQLQYPIVAPGNEPVMLAEATYERIAWMHESEMRQLRGREENVALLAHFKDITRPFPGVPVGELVRSGKVSVEELFPGKMKRAA